VRAMRASVAVLLMISAGYAGCGSVKRPEIELAGVRVAGIGLRGASLIADLDINNPNDFDIETDSITYQLSGNTSGDGTWQPMFQRTYAQRIVIPEDQRTRVEIPIEFNYSDLSGAARSLLDRGTFNYRIEGNAYVREPMRRTIPFTKTGNVSLQGAR
jgi:LEA14-like dessication related protein